MMDENNYFFIIKLDIIYVVYILFCIFFLIKFIFLVRIYEK